MHHFGRGDLGGRHEAGVLSGPAERTLRVQEVRQQLPILAPAGPGIGEHTPKSKSDASLRAGRLGELNHHLLPVALA